MTDEQYDGIIEAIQNINKIEKENIIYILTKWNGETGFIRSDGQINSDQYSVYSENYINIKQNTTYTLKNLTGNNRGYCIYNRSKEIISCDNYRNRQEIEINNTYGTYIRFSGPEAESNGDNKATLLIENEVNSQQEIYNQINSIKNIGIYILGLLLVAVLLLRRNSYR